MSFFPYYGVCVWQRLVDEFLSLLWCVCDKLEDVFLSLLLI